MRGSSGLQQRQGRVARFRSSETAGKKGDVGEEDGEEALFIPNSIFERGMHDTLYL